MTQNKKITKILIWLVLSVFMITNVLNVFAYDNVGNQSRGNQDSSRQNQNNLKQFRAKMKFKDLSKNIQEKDSTKKAKKLDAIKKSIDNNWTYKLLIKSNDNLENISNFFLSYDNGVSIKKLWENVFSVKLKKTGDLYMGLFSGVSDNSIPEKLLDKYEVVQPQLLQISQDLALTWEQQDKLRRQDEIWLNNYLKAINFRWKIKVWIIDSWITRDHTDLKNNINTIYGYDFVEKDNDPQDDNGHGTHIAGIIWAELNGEWIYWVNPNNVDIVPLKIMNKDGYWSSYDLIDAINYAKDSGVKILNISLWWYADPANNPVCNAITEAKNAWVITVVAAWNDNTNVSNIVPAGCSDAIAVWAVDKDWNKISFSNYWKDRKSTRLNSSH